MYKGHWNRSSFCSLLSQLPSWGMRFLFFLWRIRPTAPFSDTKDDENEAYFWKWQLSGTKDLINSRICKGDQRWENSRLFASSWFFGVTRHFQRIGKVDWGVRIPDHDLVIGTFIIQYNNDYIFLPSAKPWMEIAISSRSLFFGLFRDSYFLWRRTDTFTTELMSGTDASRN